MAVFTYTNPTVGGSEDTWGTTLNANWTALGSFLGTLDSAELAVLDGVTATTAELNLLDGVTATTAEINILDGVTATAAELNILDGVTATTAELNFVDGVTSAIQTQLDDRVSANADDTLSGGYVTAVVDDGVIASGAYTPSPSGGNMRKIVAGGPFTFTAPTAIGDYTLVIQITNNASAGAITESGFSILTGDPFTTTTGDDFFVFVTKCNGFISAHVQALQ